MEHVNQSVLSVGSRLVAPVNPRTTITLCYVLVPAFWFPFSDKVTIGDGISCKVLFTYAGVII
jgi:hypothetical protein